VFDYVLSRRAEDDVESILDYIAQDDPYAALGFYENLERLFKRLAEHPKIGRERSEIAAGIRSIPTGCYVVYFELENPVQIVRVLHSALNLDEDWPDIG
jgi:toxin ParE1/3/4